MSSKKLVHFFPYIQQTLKIYISWQKRITERKIKKIENTDEAYQRVDASPANDTNERIKRKIFACDVVFIIIYSNKLKLNEAKSNVIDFDKTLSDQKRMHIPEEDRVIWLVSRCFSSESIENTLIPYEESA